MKKVGIFFIIIGLVLIGMAGYGYIQLSNAASDSRMSTNDVEMLLSLSDALGVNSMMSATDRIMLFSVKNRMVLLIVGIFITILGFLLKSANKEKREGYSEPVKEWVCKRCNNRNPVSAGKCRKCGADKPLGVSQRVFRA